MAYYNLQPKFSEASAWADLNNFLSKFHDKNGYALPSRYEVLILPPGEPLNLNSARKVSMRVESIEMPGRALNTSPDSNRYGIQPEIVDGITFAGTIGLTIQTSSDLEERVFFQSWQELAWNRSTWNVGYYNDYVGTMEIYILDINNNKRYGVKIIDCFPKEIGPISLSYTQAIDIIKTPITMEYKYWETLDLTDQPNKVSPTVLIGAERNLNANIPKVKSTLGYGYI